MSSRSLCSGGMAQRAMPPIFAAPSFTISPSQIMTCASWIAGNRVTKGGPPTSDDSTSIPLDSTEARRFVRKGWFDMQLGAEGTLGLRVRFQAV